jgi:High potential iron-sulfur protein
MVACFVLPAEPSASADTFFTPNPQEFCMPLPNQRRVFLLTLASSTAAVGTLAQAQALVDEKDPQAAALGYVADAKRVDGKKFPKFAAGQVCSNCSLYQGKATDKAAGCPLFAGKLVAGPGWCSAWVKKA